MVRGRTSRVKGRRATPVTLLVISVHVLVPAVCPSPARAEAEAGPWTALVESVALAVRGDWEAAESRINRVPARSRPPELEATLALVLAARGRAAEAGAALDHARAARPTLAEAHFWAGVVSLRAMRPRPALEAFDLALSLRPDRPEYRLGRALANAAAGHTDAAVEDVIASARADPIFIEPSFHPDERRGVIRLMERGLEGFPAKVPTEDLVIRSLLDASLGREARARASASESAVALEVRGRLAMAAGDPEVAETLLSRALARDPSSAEARFHLARVAFARGSHAQARRLLREAAELAPDDARVQVALGDLALEQGDLDGAELAYGYALVRVRSPHALLGLGRVRELHGDLDGAGRAYRDALRLAPAGIESLERLARLLERSAPGSAEARAVRRRLDAATRFERRLETLVQASEQEATKLVDACALIERDPAAASARLIDIRGPRAAAVRSFALAAAASRSGRVPEARRHAKLFLRSVMASDWAEGARPWVEVRGSIGGTAIVRIVPVDYAVLR